MRIWVFRHGESETNKEGQWTGWLDAPLTDRGRAEARALTALTAGKHFDKVYASDLSRAMETAALALPGCEPIPEPMLREINVGSIAGKSFSVVFYENGNRMNEDGYAAFGGESMKEMTERVGRFIERLEGEGCERIAVFCHAGVVRRFISHTIGAEMKRGSIFLQNCAACIFDYDEKGWHLYSLINQN